MNKEKIEGNLFRGQVIIANKERYLIEYNDERIQAEVSGRFKYISFQKSDYPVVGDYVYFRDAGSGLGIIERIEARKSIVSRMDVGYISEEHILASNVDMAFVCMSLNKDFNLKKLQNFLTLTYNSNIETIILLTKKDLVEDYQEYIEKIRRIDNEEIMVVNSFNDFDIQQIREKINTKTVVFLGSSGVGKSTIINSLCNEEKFATKDIRLSDSQGRHTTTHRELVKLESGGKVIDTPGIRIVSSYFIDESNFEDILDLAKECQYRDCSHTIEPNCHIKYCLENDILSEERYNQYLKAIRINEFSKKRQAERLRIQNKRKKNSA